MDQTDRQRKIGFLGGRLLMTVSPKRLQYESRIPGLSLFNLSGLSLFNLSNSDIFRMHRLFQDEI